MTAHPPCYCSYWCRLWLNVLWTGRTSWWVSLHDINT